MIGLKWFQTLLNYTNRNDPSWMGGAGALLGVPLWRVGMQIIALRVVVGCGGFLRSQQ